ncbi:hypothetical protein [Maritimibacter sp. DP1N21-5]|uniref:hypothetical protein n=1 Tax=Maritimibacter sp. DP1N21-5 TaxID=2836867 RepID=UPI001C492BBC|nr:hypothetical protein [Maritimibacter sp. DP1N21-5]MBV7408417.1 hypothetical protein [Maritimibacter sp. DP1N21-5]
MVTGWTRYLRGLATSALCANALFTGAATAESATAADDAALAAQWETYNQYAVPSVLEMSPMREVTEVALPDGGALALTALHPGVNRWFVLDVTMAGATRRYHLENADEKSWRFSLSEGPDPALVIAGLGEETECRPWKGDTSELATASQTGLPYAPICGQKAYLRNVVPGSKTNREAVSDFLRDNVVFGDKLVNLIKGAFYEDAFIENAAMVEDGDAGETAAALGQANLDRRPIMRPYMGLELDGAEGGMEAGAWYGVTGQEGVFASALQPGMIAQSILAERNGANWLDGVEQGADVYLVAFDLSRFDLGYELGTDHPGLEWSSRPQRRGDDWQIPGPDGFNRPDPLVRNGMLSPALTSRTVATFAGGFKRDHGAYRFQDYATFNKGHHYGFLSNGVTFSRLMPNLATLYVTLDGTVGMKTWTEEDNDVVPDLRYARQNGVPLVVRNEAGQSVPGDRVSNWGGGNWSGSAEAELRTLRAGVCLREVNGRQFLIYGYFSSVTPSAMARVFQAYDCGYGMLLDMNSPELTYLAVYKQNETGDGLAPMHLNRFMAESDPWVNGRQIPRFIGFSDNRDFFYMVRKE